VQQHQVTTPPANSSGFYRPPPPAAHPPSGPPAGGPSVPMGPPQLGKIHPPQYDPYGQALASTGAHQMQLSTSPRGAYYSGPSTASPSPAQSGVWEAFVTTAPPRPRPPPQIRPPPAYAAPAAQPRPPTSYPAPALAPPHQNAHEQPIRSNGMMFFPNKNLPSRLGARNSYKSPPERLQTRSRPCAPGPSPGLEKSHNDLLKTYQSALNQNKELRSKNQHYRELLYKNQEMLKNQHERKTKGLQAELQPFRILSRPELLCKLSHEDHKKMGELVGKLAQNFQKSMAIRKATPVQRLPEDKTEPSPPARQAPRAEQARRRDSHPDRPPGFEAHTPRGRAGQSRQAEANPLAPPNPDPPAPRPNHVQSQRPKPAQQNSRAEEDYPTFSSDDEDLTKDTDLFSRVVGWFLYAE